MGAFGYAIILAFAGTLAAALWTFVVGLGGVPGALLTARAMRRSGARTIPTWGLLATLAGQLYVSLAFTAVVIQTTRSLVGTSPGYGRWVAWVVTLLVGCAPAFIALKDSARAEAKNVQHGATTLTAPLTVVGFFVFVFVPKALEAGWGWMPHF